MACYPPTEWTGAQGEVARDVVILDDPTDTPTPTPTDTPTPTPTDTPTPTPTDTPTPTVTPTPTIECIVPTPIPTIIVDVSVPGQYTLPVYDTFICETQPDTNFGNNSTASLNYICAMLIEWPTLASKFQGKTVTEATLRLFVLGQPVLNMGSSVFFINPILPNWNELTATWNRSATGINWGTAGARGEDVDYDAQTMGYMSVNGYTIGWVDTPIDGSLINEWITTPASNQGIIVWSATAQNDLRIATSEWFISGFRPQLVLVAQ